MRIRKFLERLSTKTKLVVAVAAVATAIAVPAAVMAGYGPNGPDRKIFDWNNPAEHNGAFDAPRFNSYINTDVYGDERAFVDAKECTVVGDACYTQSPGAYKDKQPIQAGKEYIVRAYVHNIAHPSTNGPNNTGVGVAKNTKIRFELPEGVGNGFTAQARITADNAIPQQVYDTVDLDTTGPAVDIEYVPGSARIYNSAHQNGLALPDAIMSANGTLIGHNAMNGIYPGCFDFASFVVIRVKVKAPNLELHKRVSKVEMPKLTDSSESVTAKRGDTISWRIDYKNNGDAVVNDVTIRDELPAGLELVPGSIQLTTAAGNETLNNTALGSGGINVGDYFPNGNGVIRFRTKITAPENVCELKNVAFGRATNIPERSDDAKVIIEDCKTTQPAYSCDGIVKAFLSGNTYRFTTNATAQNGATIKQYRYAFTGTGYNQSAITNQPNGQIDHTFPGPGEYSIAVTVDFTVNGQTVSHTSNACKTSITIPKEEDKCPMPGKTHLPKNSPECSEQPTTLVSTGPADTIGVFAAVTVLGTLAHRFVLSRRFHI